MSKHVNLAILIGRVGKDPEIRVTSSGATVANFSLATNENVKDNSSGEYFERTEWHNIVAWDRTAEVVRDYVKKGSTIFIRGKFQTRSWDDKTTGVKKYRSEIFTVELGLLSSPSQSNNGNGHNNGHNNGQVQNNGNRTYERSAPPEEREEYAGVGITDDDIPF